MNRRDDGRPLHIVMTIHHHLDRAAGAPGVTLALADAYRALGHHVEVIGFDGLRVRVDRLCRLLFPPYVAARLWAIDRRSRIDVVDASSGDAAWWCRFGRERSPALIVRSHGLEHPTYDSQREAPRLGLDHLSYRYRFFQERVELPRVLRTVEAADVVMMCNSDDARYAVDRFGTDPARIRVVRQGVDDSIVDAAAHRTADPNDRTIVAIGSFIARKGVAYLVPAASELMRADERVRLRLLGTGVSEAAVLESFGPELRSRVEVVPRFERAELVGLVGTAAIGVLASVREGSPVALQELMALGLAAVITSTPGLGDSVVDEETAVVVPARDAAALRNGLAGLLGDPERALRIGAAARAAVQQSRWSVVAAENLAVYREALTRAD